MATATGATRTAGTDAWWTGRPEIRVTRWMPHTPHPRQQAFLWCHHDDVLYGGAAGGGKSDALLLAALQWADIPGYSAILFRRTYEDLNLPGALIPRSKEWLYPLLGDRAWNEQRSRWTFPSGATLNFGYLRHADDHFRYQGMEAQFIGVDEAGQIRPNQLRYLFSRLRKVWDGPLGQVPVRMRLASNPGGIAHDYLKARYIDRLMDPDDPEDTPERARDRIFIPAKLADNPSLDQPSYRASLANLEPEVRAQLLDGDWDARQPGDWYFDERHLAAVFNLGRLYEAELQAGTLEPYGGIVDLGIDTGDNWHSVLAIPLEGGGLFIAREYVSTVSEAIEATHGSLALNTFYWPWRRASFDSAGKLAMATFVRESGRRLSFAAPKPFKVSFAKYKGPTAMYLRRLVRRAHGTFIKDQMEVPEGTDGAVFLPGPLPGHLAISPRCPELARQIKLIHRDPESKKGEWLKDDDQHGPDAVIAVAAPVAKRWRAAVAGEKVAA